MNSPMLMFTAVLISMATTHVCATPPVKRSNLFLQNVGQIRDQSGHARPDINYRFPAGNGLSVFIGPDGISYQWSRPVQADPNDREYHNGQRKTSSFDLYRMDVKLIGANKNVIPVMNDREDFHETYYASWTGPQGSTSYGCSKITYRNIYPNTDWVLYRNSQGNLEYDFILHPGADISRIKIVYCGATEISIDDAGHLHARCPFGAVSECTPKAREMATGNASPITFQLIGDTLQFVGDGGGIPLIIDPVIQWSSYFGGNDNDFSSAITASTDGYVYMVGGVNSVNNIVTTGAFQTTYGGGGGYLGNDAFLSKFDSLGNCLWSTYYGGSEEEVALALSCDSMGNVFFAGYTAGSTGLATPGAFQTSPQGGYDAWLAKFNAAGQRLWASYYGGPADDCYGGPVSLESDGANVYLAGSSQSSGLASSGAAQTTPGGYDDAILVKFDGSGSRLWATYLGGEGSDYGYNVAVGPSGAILLTGSTNSTTGIASGTVYQPTPGGQSDAFVARYNDSGQRLWSTYLGAGGADVARSIVTDDSSRIYITGITGSTAGLATPGAYQSIYGGGTEDAFLARLSPAGMLDWFTYYGGSDMDEGLCITAKDNHLLVSGLTASTNSIATTDAFQLVNGGSTDGFIGKFDLSGNPEWASYYGGVDWDQVFSIAAGVGNDLYFCGYTLSGAGIASPGSYQPIYGGGDGDGFMGCIKDCMLPEAPVFTTGDTVVCSGSSLVYAVNPSAGNTYNWTLPVGWLGSSDSSSIHVVAGSNGGAIMVQSLNSCGISDTSGFAVTVNPAPDTPVITAVNGTLSIAAGYASYQWMLDGVSIAGATSSTLNVTSGGVYTVEVSNEFGCQAVSLPYTVSATGIDDQRKYGEYRIYPNPASGQLFIEASMEGRYSVYAIDGRFILSAILNKEITQIKTADWKDGIYLIRICDKEGAEQYRQKVMVNKGL